MTECTHRKVTTYVFVDGNEPTGLWACADCGHKFVPLNIAAEKDAERYRWLKERKGIELRSGHGEWRRLDGTLFMESHYLAEGNMQHAPAESLDATIDAAMLARSLGAA